MAAIITDAITSRAFELIRVRIGLILAEELVSQSTLNADPNLAATVYIERSIPPSDEEMPMVNVSTAKGDYDLLTSLKQDGTYIFHIDIHTKAKSTGTNPVIRGDSMASVLCQRLTGVVQAILSDAKYRTLGFAPPFIEHVEVSNIQFATPVNEKDASSVMMGRVTFSVRVPENVEDFEANLIEGYDTSVELNNSNSGYVFSGNNAPIPPPTCEPSTITDSDGVSTFQVSSGGTGACTVVSNDIDLKFNFEVGDDLTDLATITAFESAIYTSISDDGASGDITVSIDGGPFVAFSTLNPLTLIIAQTIQFKRTVTTANGFTQITGTF